MPETRVIGHDGSATVTGHNAKFKTWAATISQQIVDTSAFGDTWRTKRGALQGGTFSAGGVISYDTVSTAPNSDALTPAGVVVSLVVAVDTNNSLSGTAVIGNVAFAFDNEGEAGVTFDGEFTGAIVEAWDETG